MIAGHVGGGAPKTVVNISSGLGHSTSPLSTAYSTSKWAVESLSKGIAQSFKALNLAGAMARPRCQCWAWWW